MDPMSLFEKATAHGCVVMDAVGVDQLGLPTPCEEWSLQDLIDHMVGSTDYLLAAIDGREVVARVGASADDYRRGRIEVRAGLSEAGTRHRAGRA